jgi:hypothetical protein
MTNNLKKSGLIFGLLISITLTSCVSTYVANLQRTSDKEVEVFTTIKPTKEYIELKYIQVDGAVFNQPEKLLTKLTQRAKKEGADAVINVKYDYQWTWPIISGTAIKYKDK